MSEAQVFVSLFVSDWNFFLDLLQKLCLGLSPSSSVMFSSASCFTYTKHQKQWPVRPKVSDEETSFSLSRQPLMRGLSKTQTQAFVRNWSKLTSLFKPRIV